jgi:hypothetical protein
MAIMQTNITATVRICEVASLMFNSHIFRTFQKEPVLSLRVSTTSNTILFTS